MEKTLFDVIIVGGGPAGMMAALSAKHHHPEYRVAILDQSRDLGRKLLVSGAGRGNLTNRHLEGDPARYYFGNAQLISGIYSRFGYPEIVAFFDNIGIPLYEETKTGKGKMFPVIDNAKTVRDVIIEELMEKEIRVFCSVAVRKISSVRNAWRLETSDGSYSSRYLILACGGRTYPSLGSDGSGYELAGRLGHRITEPVPSAVPLVSKNPLSHFLQGEKAVMKVEAVIGGDVTDTAAGEVLFTQYGFSGPAILDISRTVSLRINREKINDVRIRLSFFPEVPVSEIRRMLRDRWKKYAGRPVSASLWGLLTEKAAAAVCQTAGISRDRAVLELTEDMKNRIQGILTSYDVPVNGTRGWNEAEFTAGGVSTDDIDPVTLESTIAEHLYFAGEIMDVDGPVGGYNLSWAWSSGWVAGMIG